MIIQYSCRNYKSIKNEISFGMEASADKIMPYQLISDEFSKELMSEKILKFACIYGDNGSGKSSFVNSLMSLVELITDNDVLMPYEKLVQIPHKLSSPKDTTDYYLTFEKKGIQYQYELIYNEDNIFKENLFFWPNGRRALIYEREGGKIHTSDSFKIIETVCRDKISENKVLLPMAAREDPYSVVADVYDFFNNDLVFYNGKENDWLAYTAEGIEKNKVVKDLIIETLNDNDIPIRDIYARVDKMPVSEYEIPQSLPEAYKKVLRNKKKKIPIVKLKYDKFEVSIEEESEGVRKLFTILGPVINIIVDDKILICDEIESYLHPKAVRYLLDLFTIQNLRKAQLITTTHSLDFIDNKVLRRDQIWMTYNDNPERSTKLYRLSDLNGVRKDENLRANYMNGVYKMGKNPEKSKV